MRRSLAKKHVTTHRDEDEQHHNLQEDAANTSELPNCCTAARTSIRKAPKPSRVVPSSVDDFAPTRWLAYAVALVD
eukprot:scaffold61399_cov37-Tisochrysis_lutea.AAC.1